jgi:hypothetical protein
MTPSPKEQFHVPFRRIVFPKKGIYEKIFCFLKKVLGFGDFSPKIKD